MMINKIASKKFALIVGLFFLVFFSFSFVASANIIVSPTENSIIVGQDVLFNVSINSSVKGLDFENNGMYTSVCSGVYCILSVPGSNFGEGINLVQIGLTDEEGSILETISTNVCYDSQDPQIFLIGGDETLIVGDVYTDKGATANDTDGTNLTSVINADISGVNTAVADTYYVFYNVTDNAGNTAYANRTVIVNAAPVVVSGGNGGGSGGYCVTTWDVSEWSDCIDGVQTRGVSYPENYCAPTTDKPVESQTCESENNEVVEEVSDDTTTQGFFPAITGAVIGTNAGRWSLGILIFLILVGLAWWIVAAKKRKAKKTEKKAKK